MASADEYRGKIKAMGLKNLTIEVSNVSEAKAALADVRQRQKELRQLKSMLLLDMKAIRAQYEQKRQSAGTGGATMISLFGKRKAAGQYRASAKRQLTAQRDGALQPYESIKRMIDDLLLQMDGAKLKIQQYIEQVKNSKDV